MNTQMVGDASSTSQTAGAGAGASAPLASQRRLLKEAWLVARLLPEMMMMMMMMIMMTTTVMTYLSAWLPCKDDAAVDDENKNADAGAHNDNAHLHPDDSDDAFDFV
jgi:hypothetical protein